MNPRIDAHFAYVESLLLESPAIKSYQIMQCLVGPTDGKPVPEAHYRPVIYQAA
jgi:hypothetical protein